MTTEADRYPWTYPVRDAFDRDAVVQVGAEHGRVIVTAPAWWTADPDTADSIDLAVRAASDRARRQRHRGQS